MRGLYKAIMGLFDDVSANGKDDGECLPWHRAFWYTREIQ